MVRLLLGQDHKAIPNYKLLETALQKAGMEQPLDVGNLTKAQPQVHFELLQRIYALAPPATPGSAKGLRQIDANSLDGSGRAGIGKRGGGGGGSKRQLLKRSAEEIAPAAEEAAATDEIAGDLAATAAAAAAADELRAQLEQMRLELDTSRAEAHSLREEADFYIHKLEAIEEACLQQPPAQVAASVLGLLHADASGAAQLVEA